MKKILFILVAVFVLAFTFGCSRSDKSTSSKTTTVNQEVTNKQAKLLANALYKNHQYKGAIFTTRSGSTDSGFISSGQVGWGNDEAAFVDNQVVISNTNPDLQAIYTSNGVYERLINIDTTNAQEVKFNEKYVLRNFDPNKYGIDALNQFISKLAASSPDNPVLIKQNGARYLGEEKVGNKQTSKFKISDNITYFIAGNGDLVKVIANVKGFENPVEVEFVDFKEASFVPPTSDRIINFDDIADEYLQVRPPF